MVGVTSLGDAPGLGIRIDEQAMAAYPSRPATKAADGPGVRPERAGQRLLAVAG
jgi:hypothetical protein